MIFASVIGDKEIVARFEALPGKLKSDIDATVKRMGFKLQAKVQTDYLRGPRPDKLGVVTSRLINSILQGSPNSLSRFESTPTSAYAYVGTLLDYGKMWEEGFAKKIGYGARGGFGARGGKIPGQKAIASAIAKSPPGTKDYAPRQFLHPALEDMREQFYAEMQAACERSLK